MSCKSGALATLRNRKWGSASPLFFAWGAFRPAAELAPRAAAWAGGSRSAHLPGGKFLEGQVTPSLHSPLVLVCFFCSKCTSPGA